MINPASIEPAYINAMLIATATLTLSDRDFVFMPVVCQTGCPNCDKINYLEQSLARQAFESAEQKRRQASMK